MSPLTEEIMAVVGAGSAAERKLPIGAEFGADGAVHFRVWAPRRQRVEVVFSDAASVAAIKAEIKLTREPGGYFSGAADHIAAGTRYGLKLDDCEQIFPDPASRFQPDGPEGLSEIIDPSCFRWTDHAWKGVCPEGQVIYEMHIGTFTPEGTWAAATSRLPELVGTGMTMVEVMPVADFPGEFGWGYDGVSTFAPTRLYGRPDDFRRFVDRAHALGMGVILDVVYNHFGPLGNWLPQFSDDYISRRHRNAWGASINFDGENSGPVREFFLTNVAYWISEFHLDGVRFDATDCIHDESAPHILTELVAAARETAGPRSLFLVAENEHQNVRMVKPASQGGHGMSAVWNDDFHHSARVRLTGHNEAYYSDYLGSMEELLALLKRGYLYQGQHSRWQKQPRGTPTTGLSATAFVNFLQNHDQIANSARGERIDRLTSPGRLRAMTALWLLAPQTPMFFQGQEYGSATPFQFFAHNSGEHAQRVKQGRAEFLSQFPSIAVPEVTNQLADPADRETFERCRLHPQERPSHGQALALHTDLLRLRRDDPIFRRQRADLLDGATLGPDCLLVRFFGDEGDDRLLLVNLGLDLFINPVPNPLFAPPTGRTWNLQWHSDSVRYGGSGAFGSESDQGWRIPGETAVLFSAVSSAESSSRRNSDGTP